MVRSYAFGFSLAIVSFISWGEDLAERGDASGYESQCNNDGESLGDFKIKGSYGILGSGQLAWMLANAAKELGIRPHIFATSSKDKTALENLSIEGKLTDPIALNQFYGHAANLIFESENVDCNVLELSAMADVKFFPPISVIRKLQDKYEQKLLWHKLGVQTSEFIEIDLLHTNQQIEELVAKWGGALVLKWARMGYDGLGVLVVDEKNIAGEQLRDFISKAKANGSRVYAEKKINFKRELALVSTATQQGKVVHYPLVVTEQEAGVCKLAYGPAQLVGVSSKIEEEARAAAKKLVAELGIIGTFAIEFFEDADGRLLVNEVAPRVHNSGHFSLDAGITSQFENHWRALAGMPLGKTDVKGCFGMINLLGPSRGVGYKKPAQEPQLSEEFKNMKLYWYGKPELRPARKMGHINLGSSNPADLMQVIAKLQAAEASWAADL